MALRLQIRLGRCAAALALLCSPAALWAQDSDVDEPQRFERIGTPLASPDKIEQRLADEAAEFARRERACEAGDIAACGDLGVAYELGIGTAQNRPIAALLYTEACDAGSGEDCARLGLLTLVENRDDREEAAFAAFQRGCDLGSLEACASVAKAYRSGDGVVQDEALGSALARETCERGGAKACYDMAIAIHDNDPERVRLSETNALLLNACEGGAVEGCIALISNITYYPAGPDIPPEMDLRRRACDLEDVLSCAWLGDAALNRQGTRGRDAALQYYDRVCYLGPDLCSLAEDVRREPILYRACQNDGVSACAELGELYRLTRTSLADDSLAKAYAEYACYAGATEACAFAASQVMDEAPELPPERALQAQAYLERGCAADHMPACYLLADAFERGEIVEADRVRAIELKVRLCENGWFGECERLERAYGEDPDVPLIEAGARYLPPIEEGDENPYISEEQREAERNRCVTSEIEFRGQVYFDRVCRSSEAVINGEAVAPGEAPWQVLIWRPTRGFGQDLSAQNRVLCGGSHIAPGWILTAAHCLRDDGGWIARRGYTVRLGVSNPRKNEGITYPILRVYRHPEFNSRTFAYDIGLIRYDTASPRRAPIRHKITAIAPDGKSMSERVIRRGDEVHVYGWGWTTEDENEGVSTTQLQTAKLLLESPSKCNSILTDFERSQWNTMLCAAGANGANACKGDSGGPLITYDRGKPVVVGVVSSGRACGQAGEASRYVRVAAARDWIDGVMGVRR